MNEESIKNKIYYYLDKNIKNNTPEAVLLSGGIDSSAIAYIAQKYNPNIKAITVTNDLLEGSDKSFAIKVSNYLGIKNHLFATLDERDINKLIEKVVISLECFNIYWVSAALVLFKGIEFAKKNGIKSVATGEGSDDLFGSFQVMVNWEGTNEELMDFIFIRMNDIDVMTQKVSKFLGVDVILPFHDKDLIKFALSLPINKRFRKNKNGSVETKYLLRAAFRDLLPNSVVARPQTMAFSGASTLDILTKEFENYRNIKEYQKKYNIKFSTGFECYLFDILNKHNKYKKSTDGPTCLYCHSKLRSEKSVHCTTCGTLQYKGKILPF